MVMAVSVVAPVTLFFVELHRHDVVSRGALHRLVDRNVGERPRAGSAAIISHLAADAIRERAEDA